jgi:PBSX family phage terminase large subunit
VIVGKTERTIKQNVIAPIEDMIGSKRVKYGQDGLVTIDGRKCLMVGANDARAEGKIRGGTFAGAYCDEITLLPEAFFKMLLSRLSVPGAELFGTTNPDSPFHWFKRDFLDNGALDLVCFHFILDDNPHLPPAYVQSLKAEYKGLWYRRFIDGEWCQAEGAVYGDQWDEEACTFTGYTRQVEWWAAADYGTTNPTTYGIYSRDASGVESCWHEYWWDSRAERKQKTDEQYVDDWFTWLQKAQADIAEEAKAAGLPVPLIQPQHLSLDPAAASLRVAFERRGVRVEKANNDVIEGIKCVAGKLAKRTFRIHKRCTQSIREMGAYVWDAKAQSRGEDAPLKTDDHTQDRHRYALYKPAFKPDHRTSAQIHL